MLKQIVLWTAGSLLVIGTLTGCDSGDSPTIGAAADEPTSQPRAKSTPKPNPTPNPTPTSKPKPKPKPKPPRRYLVTHVVDGDTVDLGNGETVRLVGIDTPERGQCGYDEATRNLVRLVQGKAITLTVSDEDRDRYGRLLRYVNVGNVDAGLEQIRAGLAIARYDSRDGYGFHPRERQYIRVDKNTPSKTTCPQPKPTPTPEPQPAGNCASGYSPCIPLYPPDLDCADVNGPIFVTGSDPHGLDRDNDGVACEW